MKRALWPAILAGLAVGVVLYVLDVELARRAARRGEAAYPAGGAGRVDVIQPTGVFPVSAHTAPEEARAQGMASWGQGRRGAAGYPDSGRSEP